MKSLMNTPHGQSMPSVLKGFEHIRRYWDNSLNGFAAKILPGEFYVTQNDEAVITTLGSCVSACIRDKIYCIGGMNHFMLPECGGNDRNQDSLASAATRYGSYAMEKLINEILKAGGRRENLEIKLTGGGRVLANMTTDIGGKNINFVKDYLFNEGLKVIGEDLGGTWPRRVVYFPASGKVRVKKMRNNELIKQEQEYQKKIHHTQIDGDIELF